MAQRDLKFGIYLGKHGDQGNAFQDADWFPVPRFDSGAQFDNDRLVIEHLNMGDVWIMFNDIISLKQMIFVKETDPVTVRLMQAFQAKKMIHYMRMVVYEEYTLTNNGGDEVENGVQILEMLDFQSVTITGLWPRIRDPNLPPDLAKIDTDVVTIAAEIFFDRAMSKTDPANKKVKWTWRTDSYPRRGKYLPPIPPGFHP